MSTSLFFCGISGVLKREENKIEISSVICNSHSKFQHGSSTILNVSNSNFIMSNGK